MKNEDNDCFKWPVARTLNPVGNDLERITKGLRKQSEELDNWCMLEFPVAPTHNSVKNLSR